MIYFLLSFYFQKSALGIAQRNFSADILRLLNRSAETPYKSIKVGECIGKGAQGEVRKAEVFGKTVALKRITFDEKNAIVGLLHLDCPNLVEFLDHHLPIPEEISSKLKQMLDMCWRKKSAERPEFETILEEYSNLDADPYFVKITENEWQRLVPEWKKTTQNKMNAIRAQFFKDHF
ncbi:unnamed protein product [Enterobius vermicularis]|uniref:Protein kinase domain-containing protein n=1 Tax=Enterobius vermicularis TaxID=51028 RepID=A0A0N4VGQ2_ENTVE|nr:unnamed protein product [Enterobius vermicularis]